MQKKTFLNSYQYKLAVLTIMHKNMQKKVVDPKIEQYN